MAGNKTYKKTLNLPRTSFSMKANLVQQEPLSQKRWDADGLYRKLRERRAGEPRYVFHDGPPYANGEIHLGHLLNKVMKDFVVRSRNMLGYDCPFVPGWDCHGLPIEHKVLQESREAISGKSGDVRAAGHEGTGAGRTNEADSSQADSTMAIRRACRKYAQKYVKLQSQQMRRLLTLADYDEPYLTMNPGYEAATLEVFATLLERGLVYRGLKPVHWSIENRTALAEAELEYHEREDTSVYVWFERLDEPGEALMIWTTTPWTLPANLAVAVSPQAEYGLYQLSGRRGWIACDLAEKVAAAAGESLGEPERVARGEEMVGWTYVHPFMEGGVHGADRESGEAGAEHDRPRAVVAADYVTLEDGTGLVHTAPGHGVEDYQTGLREGLPIYCPVQGDGTFDATAPDWLQGASVWEANGKVCQRLVESGHMFHQQRFTHSYPHDWRGKTPVIFRATEQWFVSVDKTFETPAGLHGSLRQFAIRAADEDVDFFPEWGRNRMRGMLESRPDWCLSRQRAWGLPIPAFFGDDPGRVLLTPASVRAVATLIGQKGSDVWFVADAEDLLQHYDPSADPDAPAWLTPDAVASLQKSTDIFDVWFESGSSWHACVRQRFGDDAFPTDLYLEGSDQHRGWFQLSLLPAIGVTGHAPFRNVLTHGFMVDRHGHKMSKSLGNALNVEDLLKNFGADVCRWWVASLNTENDIKVDAEYFKLAGEAYRKIRNTIRYLLSNLNDFDPSRHAVTFGDRPQDARSPDAWALNELMELVDEVRGGYERFAFRRASEALFNFCNDTLSAVYASAVKDRLYCDEPDSPRRRRTQTALWRLADALIRLLAPIMPHTAEEAFAALHGPETESVHLTTFPEPEPVQVDAALINAMSRRDAWMRAIEQARRSREIDNPLDLGLRVAAAPNSPMRSLEPVDLADLCGVSRFEWREPSDDAGDQQRTPARGQPSLEGAESESVEVVDLRDAPRCERSWKRDGTVRFREDPNGELSGELSDRDARVVGLS